LAGVGQQQEQANDGLQKEIVLVNVHAGFGLASLVWQV
jgi:hypothetical protein